MTLAPGPRPPWRLLAGLTVAVLAAHLLALRHPPGTLTLQAPVPRAAGLAPPLTVRTIAPATPAPAPLASRTEPAPVASVLAMPAPARLQRAANHAAIEAPKEAAALASRPSDATEIIATAAPAEVAAATPPPPAAQDVQPLPAAFSLPGSTRLRYEVRGEVRHIPYRADGLLQWSHDGSNYQARLEISALLVGTRQQTSVGRVTPDGLAPVRFSDRSRSEQAAHFERDKGRISFSNNAPSVALQPGAQDRLSLLIQLGAMVAGDPARFKPGTSLAVQTASVREADVWVFTVAAAETLALPGGERRTLKLIRNPRHEFDQKVELWLSPDMDYLPVRLKLTQANGDWADQQWLATDKP
ncbi:MAG: DUF3108 domain-containing protein [Ramlibacter sp.]|nr:DUF3108 domain-containing protein [Ramlibacter sp.]